MEIRDFARRHANCVIHIINGVAGKELLDFLSDKDLKVLILGYKDFRRGIKHAEENRDTLDRNMQFLSGTITDYMGRFSVLSFDNLALEQLGLKNRVSPEDWEDHYMGDDGTHTMYIDLVEKTFARNSVSEIRHPLTGDIREMFRQIKS
ncbi:hypothetical protein [Breznakiella homolactica]|uniref:Uncharacterized protein n=1 Tax=Breznakiella homolactica TaxID=2798577 RepID=A0A7T7XJM6_9SPIR|nr:hypothetical protein [Breznakiella homolactica]QQO07591.1 hypothetical protein JFL75_11605 [Breznakiella homolactica]